MKTRVADLKNVLTDHFSEPLNGATTARIDIDADIGNLLIDRLSGGEQVLVSGTLQLWESQSLPARTLESSNGQATFTLKGGGSRRHWFRLPWDTCNGANEWQIYLNPTVSSDIAAHSDGGNVMLNLAGMTVTRVSADTGAGNTDVILPDNAENLNVIAKTGAGDVTVEIGSGITGSSIVNASSGAGNVLVSLPSGSAARIHATTGLGKVIMDPYFSRTDTSTYQSPGFESSANQVEITATSGLGNVIVSTR